MSSPWHTVHPPLALADICTHLNLPQPKVNPSIIGLAPLGVATPAHLSFLDNPKYVEAAASTRAGAVFIHPKQAGVLPEGVVALVTTNPYAAFARAMQLFYPQAYAPGVDATAMVHKTATVHKSAHIGPHCTVGAGCVVGEGTVLVAGVTLQKTVLGKNVVIHPGARLGQDGFGFAMDGDTPVKIPQIGGVKVGDNVEIGANTTIDCGALADTVIEDDVKLDNQVQIAHNVVVGKGTRIAGQSGIAGSTVIGAYGLIGGQVAVAGHLKIAERVTIAARSGVTKSVTETGAVIAGLPAEPMADWRRRMAAMARLAKRK